jgi:2-polyprenyl-6-methoxyphenol hydroxylase-like FAD-dependent oxidoreductase
MTQNFAADVLICGAGAAGLTLAIDLARRNVSFRLIDKASTPFGGSRGKGIQPRSLEVLEDLGVVDRIAAAGGSYPPQREYRDGTHVDSPIGDEREPTPAEPYGALLMVPQFLTEGVLRERLLELGHRPHFGCELTGLEQDDAGVTARIASAAGEEMIRVRYLVGADGGRSFVRHRLGVDFPGQTLGVRAVVADLVLEGLSSDAWHRWDGGMGRMALCPLRGTDLFQLQAPVPIEGDIDISTAGLNDMIARRTGRRDITVHSVAWASVYSMSARLADRYRVGRVFLAGDAAHTHPPTGGQGLNTSLQDAYNLGWKLAAVLGGAPDALLDTYEEERRPIAAGMLGLAKTLLDATRKGGRLHRGREVQQLDLGYPQSSLSLDRRAGDPPESDVGTIAGDRAPDAPVRGRAGRQRRLFELFQGPHWTLLGYDGKRQAIVPPRPGLRIHRIAGDGDIVDEGGHVREAYGLSAGDWVLVRPDGYVGAVVTSDEGDALEDYLRSVGLPRSS